MAGPPCETWTARQPRREMPATTSAEPRLLVGAALLGGESEQPYRHREPASTHCNPHGALCIRNWNT
eukprot:4842762-Pyramimonas_sp.AAC.1